MEVQGVSSVMSRRSFGALGLGLLLVAGVGAGPVLAEAGAAFTRAMRFMVQALAESDGRAFSALIDPATPLTIYYDMTGDRTNPATVRQVSRSDFLSSMKEGGEVWTDLIGGRAQGLDCFADFVTQSQSADWQMVRTGVFVPPGHDAKSAAFAAFKVSKGVIWLNEIGWPVA